MLLHNSYRSPLGTFKFSLMQEFKSQQFFLPLGAPTYPVDIISSFFTIIAPKFLLMQVPLLVTDSAISK